MNSGEIKSIKRLGIFCFFDKDGLLDQYVERLLTEVKKILTSLYIVVNGDIKEEALVKLMLYSDFMLCRENEGFDGAAYKKVFLDLQHTSNLNEYNELVLFNGTFFGPFFEMDYFFSEMEKEEVDFWGFSQWNSGRSELFNRNIPSHLQSYFMVVREKMFHDESFSLFWNSMPVSQSYEEAVLSFEVSFSEYFLSRGFKYTSWLAHKGYHNTGSGDDSSCHLNYYKIVTEYNYPFIKIKQALWPWNEETIKAMCYLKDCGLYPLELMKEHMIRISTPQQWEYYINSLVDFIQDFKYIYIFGHGQYGKTIQGLLALIDRETAGFIVSKSKGNGEITMNDFQLHPDECIVVALSKYNILEVREKLLSRFDIRQIFLPFDNQYCHEEGI